MDLKILIVFAMFFVGAIIGSFELGERLAISRIADKLLRAGDDGWEIVPAHSPDMIVGEHGGIEWVSLIREDGTYVGIPIKLDKNIRLRHLSSEYIVMQRRKEYQP